ncbi:MAG: methionine synthase [bacterium]|nr:methionine synthase [bacterium]
MERLAERLERGEIVVGDGAWGTMLMDRGLKTGECPEAINLERREILEQIASLYLEAGAELITTNTFGASPLKLRSYSLDGRAEEINRAGVAALRGVVAGRAYLSASVGPTGELLKPFGDRDPEELTEGFERQIRAQVEGGADMICVETMTDLTEATLAVKAAKAIAPEIPVMATMTFEATPRGFFTIMGVAVEQAAAGLEQAGAAIVGSNCGNGIEKMVEIARQFRACSRLPVAIQSNAGLPEHRGGGTVYPETPEFMADKARELIDLGVAVIGGCCGTHPEHIRALRKLVDSR